MILLAGRTNTGNLRHLVVEDRCTDESGDKGSENLAIEGDPRWNVGVMSEFKVLGELEGVGGGNVSVDSEVDHGSDVTGEREAAEDLGNDTEGNLHAGNSLDDATGNGENYGEENTIQHGSGEGIGGVNGDTGGTNADGGTQDNKVDPLRNLVVLPHQAGVDVLGIGEG